MKTIISVQIEEELNNQLIKFCKEKDLKKSQVIRIAVKKVLEQMSNDEIV